ncbi:CLUMA_CG009710, isoform B [Clunio marinus]|nr:CLUMA_CG009710, isoform B [Clunio marinus]
MSTQQKASGVGRKNKSSSTGQQKDGVAVSEQNNNQPIHTNSKKHNNANAKDAVNNNNNTVNDQQSKTEKEKPHAKPTAEQIRIAQITEIKSGTQDPTREKVSQLMELTERSEEDACLALYECDNDVERAVIYLFDNLEVGALITTTKKKKSKAASGDGANEGDEFESNNHREGGRDGNNDRSRNSRGSNRGRSEGGFNRGRSRPSGDSRDDRTMDRPPRGGGTRRGGFAGSRGGRGGRMGPRVGQTSYRDQNHRNNYRNNNQDQQEIDNWDPASTQVTNDNKNDETWGDLGDWDNEEYTGSLSDTKVFTPSGATPSTGGGQDLAAPPGLESAILNPPSQNDVPQYSATVVSSTSTVGALNNGGQYGEMQTAAAQLRQALEMPLGQSASLSAEQSQYFNTLGSQNSTAYSSTVQYPYNDQVGGGQQAPRQQQQQQQRARARVPPPSKIPSTAVEMPGDGLNAYLGGVQFGELDFGTGTDESYEAEKYVQGDGSEDYAGKGSGVPKGSQSTGLSGLQQSHGDSISSSTQGDLSSSYSQRTAGTAGAQSTLDQLTKPADIYNHATGTTAGGNAYQNLSYSAAQKGSGYQNAYGTNAYNNTPSNNYPQGNNSYGYNQNSYQQGQGTQSTGQQTQTTGSNVSTANQPVNNSSSGYISNQYPVNQSGFPSQQNAYQNQGVYGNTAGLNNTDSNNAASSTSSVSSNATATTSSINTPSLGLNSTKSTAPTTIKTGSSQTTSGGVATTNPTGSTSGNGASNVVQNIPLVSSFIQPAYYQQQPYLHFEDMQLVQPRMTPMTGYYEYQTPTSLGAGVRSDGTAASNLASVAYPTMAADGRFARTDNNSSPVQSQQTGSSQQLMNLPPYAYFYGTNVMPSGFQQFPQIYSQMPATNPNAGQFAKQSAYSSGYGSTGYDTLNQTAPDYNKTAYQSAGQQAKGHSASNQTGTNSDIASSMYNKSHVTLNKVNSYDKQSFHSGTPPPFNLAGSQAGSQTQAYQQHLYLQPMAPQHNMNIHHQIHQMDGTRLAGSRRDTNSSGQRQQSSNQSKGSKSTYQSPSYWNTQN